MRPNSRLVVFGLPVVLFTALLARSAVAAETLLYDVTRVEFTASTGPVISSSGPARVEIIDNGPGTSPDPRWRGNSAPLLGLLVWDSAPPDLSDLDARVFGHHCAAIGDVLPHGAVARAVQDSIGGGTFAWMASSAFSPDGVPDPYAFFCLKGTHQSTSAWSEWVMIGRRVYQTQPPSPPVQQVTIALATNQTVRGSIPVKISATGFAAGSLRFTILIDNTQKWLWNTSATTITQWWGTTAYPNGTHSVTVRVTDSAGKTATSTVNVLVRN
jgi:hypothetical protein